METSEICLKGTVIGFEEYAQYALKDAFGSSSPFRILACLQGPLSFLVVNPYAVLDDYSFEIDDQLMDDLRLKKDGTGDVAVLCIARVEDKVFFANFRSPLIVNTREGVFRQVILQNENYGVSVMFTASGEGR